MSAKEIGKVLRQQVVQTPTATKSVKKALDALRNKVEITLPTLYYGKWWGNYEVKDWGGVMNQATPRDNFQIHVCKWSDIRKGNQPRPLQYKVGQIRKAKDSSGQLNKSTAERSIWNPADSSLDGFVNDYFYQLLRAEDAPLAAIRDLLDGIEREQQTHRVVLSIDFYYSRSLAQLGLHKDTTGTTLFVGLHYNNDQTMLGPEYIYDFCPMPKTKQRFHSPWATDEKNDVDYWPKDLVDGLEIARGKLEKSEEVEKGLLYATTMPSNGLITFVDELIFHVTPLTRKRGLDDQGTLFQTVNINATEYPLPKEQMRLTKPSRLRRQFSEKDMGGTGTGSSGRRSFVRFWIMVEPKAWHL